MKQSKKEKKIKELSEGDIERILRKCPIALNTIDYLKEKGMIAKEVPSVIFPFLKGTEELFILQDGTMW